MPRGGCRKRKSITKKIAIVEEKELQSPKLDFRDHIDSTKVSHHLFCSICQEVFNCPQRAPCGHSFCKSCILQWLETNRTCPEDRKRLNPEQLHHDFILENIIGDQKVACPFRKYGCAEVCLLSTLPSHFKSCPFNSDNLPKFLKESMESYLSKEDTGQTASHNENSNANLAAGEENPIPYISLKMRMYMEGGAVRDGLVNTFTSDNTEHNRLLNMYKDD